MTEIPWPLRYTGGGKRNNGFVLFPRVLIRKGMRVIRTHYDVAVHCFNYYTTVRKRLIYLSLPGNCKKEDSLVFNIYMVGRNLGVIYIYPTLPPLESCSVGWPGRIHRLHLCRGVRSPLPQQVSSGPVSWGFRIHRCTTAER